VVLQIERLDRSTASTTTMITPGSFGANRASANSASSPAAPTATVVQSQLPASAIVFAGTESVLPDGFSIPTTFGSWPIAI